MLLQPGSIAVGSMSDSRSSGHKFKSQLGHIAYMEIGYEIISSVILPLLLFQEGHLLVAKVRAQVH